MTVRILCLLFFFLTFAEAKIVRFDISKPQHKDLSYKKACEVVGFKNLLLVEAMGNYHLDCMGKKVTALEICQKFLPNEKNLLRGFVSKKESRVICQMGHSAILAMECDSKHKVFCETPKKSCQRFKGIFANRLDLNHHSLVRGREQLNCYFSARADIKSLIHDPLNLPPSKK